MSTNNKKNRAANPTIAYKYQIDINNNYPRVEVKGSVSALPQINHLFSIPLPRLQGYQKQTYLPVLPQQNIVFDSASGAVIPSGNEIVVSYVQVTELVRGFKLAFPVVLKIERIEENLFVAECPTFNISIPAESYEDALDEIKEVLVDDYQSFLNNYPHKLTKEALSLLRLYCAFFGENLPQSNA
jgi:hypothetical protein